MPSFASLQLWPLRALWVLLALAAAVGFGDALEARSGAVAVALATIGWLAWTGALVAMLVPRTLSLTVVRTIVPAALVAAVAAAVGGDAIDVADVVAVLAAAAATIVALAPWTTDEFVDGSSYGPEQRLSLRTPAPLALTAAATWALVVVGAIAGPVLLAAEAWAVGAVALVVGWAVAVGGSRALHQLSNRWLVLVPTGMVLRDPIQMPEAQLFLRQTMARLGPAEAGDDPAVVTEDLTGGASGLAIELVLAEPVELLVTTGRGRAETKAVDRVLFTPSRPAALLAEARQRRLPVA